MRQASTGVRAGIDGLARIFGVGQGQQQGAMPTPEDHARVQHGAMRFARGEGAATPQEIKEIDQVTGMDQVDADPGMKNLMRIDQVAQYYLLRGEKDKAEAASAALLQHGALQVKQAATMASAAIAHWQEIGDPAALEHASQFIQRAHQYIPDGTDLKIDIDPRTRQIVATTIGSDGQPQQQVIDPQAVPQLLGQAMDGSAYWKSVYQIAQPRLAEQEISQQGQNQRLLAQQQAEQYKYERNAQGEQYRHDRGLSEGLSAGERSKNANAQWFADWGQRFAAAPAEQKPALVQEAQQYRWDNTPDRQRPIDSASLGDFEGTPFDGKFDSADVQTMQGMAGALAVKNGALDAVGAMNAIGALVTAPDFKLLPDGRVSAGGLNLVFNPALMPGLNQLRQRYKGQ